VRLAKPSRWRGDSWSRHRIVVLGAITVVAFVAASLVVWSESQAFASNTAGSGAATAENVIAPVTAPSSETGITPVAVPPPIDVVRASDPIDESAPLRLTIASISVDTSLMELGLQPDGTLEVPPDGTLAGWFTGAPTPGELGPAVIAAHVDWYGPGVFYDLHRMVTGDLIEVERADGSTAVFTVTEVGQYPKNEFPTEAVYGSVNFAGLRLITCGGVFNDATGHYDDNIVVFAELVSSTPATTN
jgi:hypothetical protein